MNFSRREVLLGALASPVLADQKPPERPNLLLIVADYLPAWVLGAYGNTEVHTPNVDRLAQMGTRFTDHVVCTPAPTPSRQTMFTGRVPLQPPGDASLEKILAAAGYAVHTADAAGARSFLDAQAPGEPFFLTANVGALTPPYENVPQKYQDLYAQAKFDTFAPEPAARNAQKGKEMLADTIGSLRKAAAAVTALDDSVQSLLARLAPRRLTDNTAVVFTSTCGALLSHHGLWDAGEASEPVNMYEESVVTPLIWSWAGRVPAQGVRPELVSSYDLLPTLCEAAGVPPPAGNLCGRSYLPIVTGKPLPKSQPWRTTVFGRFGNTEMSRADRYKLVVRDAGKGPGELYDLRTDPAEKTNRYDDPQFLTVRTHLSTELEAWKSRYSAA